MSVPITLDDKGRKCRAAVLSYVDKHPACAGRDISEDIYGASFTRRDITNALHSLVSDGSIVTSGPNGAPRYTVGKPVTEDDSEALAHLKAHGALGAEILRLCRAKGISPTALLTARSQEAGRRRGAIIAALPGTDVAIAAALKVSKHTVYVHRASRSAAA